MRTRAWTQIEAGARAEELLNYIVALKDLDEAPEPAAAVEGLVEAVREHARTAARRHGSAARFHHSYLHAFRGFSASPGATSCPGTLTGAIPPGAPHTLLQLSLHDRS
eukprot:tig00020629_g12390.t1